MTGVQTCALPISDSVAAEYVIVSCGAVQSARLLWMSGPSRGLGNSSDQLGRNATFHLFGMGAKATFNEKFQGSLHGEFGHTGNTTTFAPYFVHDETNNFWFKSGTMTSTAKKNPLENASEKVEKSLFGLDLLKEIDIYNRSCEVRLTADDLPRPSNRVDLDPTHIDEYGFPVARITRDVGEHEKRMYQQIVPQLRSIFDPYSSVLVNGVPTITPQVTDLIGDHQMGTCRMGHDPQTSVLNSWCRLHDVENVFVVDSSFMPTGLGLNPMVTVVANALRVGTHIIEELKAGRQPGND